MKLTQSEIKTLALNMVNGFMGDIQMEFLAVNKAIRRVSNAEFADFMDRQAETIEEILLNKFGSSD